MIGLLIACLGALGVYLIYTSIVFGWSGFRPGIGISNQLQRGRALDNPAARLGLQGAPVAELSSFSALLALIGGAAGYTIFGGVAPALLLGLFLASAPITSHRVRRRAAIQQAQEAWPRIIEEIRVLAGAAGRSLPQAVFDAGLRGPSELRPAFASAHREWLLSTDFDRTLAVLKDELADPTADAVCETLLIAHELGGTDVDARLADLADDRLQDSQGRKDARAKQAGARFARFFVLIVPAGMALMGLQLGNGRAAYQTALGQVAVLLALSVVVGCWVWAGSIMRLPTEQRVFAPARHPDPITNEGRQSGNYGGRR